MVDPRMAQATAVHTKIATIAIIRFNMVVCASTLSAAPSNYLAWLALSSTFCHKVQTCVYVGGKCYPRLRSRHQEGIRYRKGAPPSFGIIGILKARRRPQYYGHRATSPL